MWILRWILIIIFVFFLVGFLSQNSGYDVNVRILGWTSPDMPLAYMLVIAAIIGYLLSLLVAVINHIRLRSQITALRRRQRELQAELDRLRNFALEDEGAAAAGAKTTGRRLP